MLDRRRMLGCMMRDGRAAHRDRNYMAVIAALPREGRVMRNIRRSFVALARPLSTGELCERCFGPIRKHWHFKSIYRAAPRYAVKSGRYWLAR